MIVPTAKTNTSTHDKVHLALENEMELKNFLETSQAATLQKIGSSAEENVDNLLNSLTNNFRNRKYFVLQ